MPSESGGARKYCTFGARSAARNRADVMEIVANSPFDRRQVGWQKDPKRSSVTNGNKLPYRQLLRVGARCKDIIKTHILDPGGEDNCSAAERSTCIASAGSRCWGGEDLMGLLLGLPIWAEVGAIASSLELIRGQTRRPASRDEPTEEAPPSENASDDHCGPRRRWPS